MCQKVFVGPTRPGCDWTRWGAYIAHQTSKLDLLEGKEHNMEERKGKLKDEKERKRDRRGEEEDKVPP